jgi:hypothetical protein
MTEEKKSEEPAPGKPAEKADDKQSGPWSTRAKVGAAIGSAAVAAALIYAGRHQMKKHDDFKAAKDKPFPKYENEPDYDEDDGEGDPQ